MVYRIGSYCNKDSVLNTHALQHLGITTKTLKIQKAYREQSLLMSINKLGKGLSPPYLSFSDVLF